MHVHNLSGQVFGQYELRELLGVGGMGAVYRSYQTNLKRYVAVKVMSADLAQQTDYLERFTSEAETSAALDHPNIITIHDYGIEQEISYLVMQLLNGSSLSERIAGRQKTSQPLPSLGEVTGMLRQIGSALDYAHSQGVIHRDIKPSNIMFDNHGNAYLVDFGIAKLTTATHGLTGTGVIIGTLNYMAPEQWQADKLSPATDQYALGVVTYALVTGQMPFEAETPANMMHKHLNEMPAPPHFMRTEVPEAVTQVIERALAKDANERFPTCTAFSQAFDSAIRGNTGEITNFFTLPLPRNPGQVALTSSSDFESNRKSATWQGPVDQRTFVWITGLVVVLVLIVFFALGGQAPTVRRSSDSSAGSTPIAGQAADPTDAEVIIQPTAEDTLISPQTPTQNPFLDSDTAIATQASSTAAIQRLTLTATPQTTTEISQTRTPTRTLASTSTNTLSPTLSVTEKEATIQAEMDAIFTLTATHWTLTPTVTLTSTEDLAGTAQARLAQTQAAIDATSTANAWTDTPTVTSTPTQTLTETATHTPSPTNTSTATSTATSTSTPAATPTLIETPTPIATFTPSPLPAGASNSDWIPRILEVEGSQITLVPAGCFMIGSVNGRPNEQPVRTVCLESFSIGLTEVTNAQYKLCVDAGVCKAPSTRTFYDNSSFAQHPVVYVDWEMANTFATFVGCRLPTEAEWEYASRGPENWIYPWGNSFIGSSLNFCDSSCTWDWNNHDYEDGFAETSPVGMYPAGSSWVGVQDMAGNVWEWTANWYSESYTMVSNGMQDPSGPTSGNERVVRGGSWYSPMGDVRSAFRYNRHPNARQDNIGFRIACDPTAFE